MKTAWPDVRGGLQQRLASARAPRPLLALAAEVEERVVDADRHPDQQDHGLGRVAGRDHMARERGQTDRREHAREGEQHRQAGRDERAERDQQDDQRDRQRRVLGPLEVLVQRVVELVVRAREAELGDGEAVVPVLHAARRHRGSAGPSRRPCPGRPAISNWTSAERRSLEIWPAFAGASGERTFWTFGSAETVRTTSATAARNARIGRASPSSTRRARSRPRGSGSRRRCSICSAVFVPPAAVSASFSIFVPATDAQGDRDHAEGEPGRRRRSSSDRRSSGRRGLRC